jgi:hypothetical protein
MNVSDAVETSKARGVALKVLQWQARTLDSSNARCAQGGAGAQTQFTPVRATHVGTHTSTVKRLQAHTGARVRQ